MIVTVRVIEVREGIDAVRTLEVDAIRWGLVEDRVTEMDIEIFEN